MWRPLKLARGTYCCEHTKTWDQTDREWPTEAEAQAWAEATNAANDAKVAENKRLAAERKAKQEAIGTPTLETHTFYGDDGRPLN